MAKGTLLNKVFESHFIADLPTGEKQIFIDCMPVHEVTSAPEMIPLAKAGFKVPFPSRIKATYDHTVPTDTSVRPFSVFEDERLVKTLEENAEALGIELFDIKSGRQGIVHVVFLEQGIAHPGMTMLCGDSHTSTYGAVGAIAKGVGTTEVGDVLTTQTLNMI